MDAAEMVVWEKNDFDIDFCCCLYFCMILWPCDVSQQQIFVAKEMANISMSFLPGEERSLVLLGQVRISVFF